MSRSNITTIGPACRRMANASAAEAASRRGGGGGGGPQVAAAVGTPRPPPGAGVMAALLGTIGPGACLNLTEFAARVAGHTSRVLFCEKTH